MDLTGDDLDELFEEELASEIHPKFSLTGTQSAKFNLKDLDREVFQFDEDSDTDRVKSSNCSVWSQEVDDWGDLELPQNSPMTLGGNRKLEDLSEMNEDDDMGLVIPDTDSPFDLHFTKTLKPAKSRDILSESDFGFESENELGSNIETLGSPEKAKNQNVSNPSKKPMLITMDMMSGLLAKKPETPIPAPKTISERLNQLTARLSRPKHLVAVSPQTPVTPSARLQLSRPSTSVSRTLTRPTTATSQASTLSTPRPLTANSSPRPLRLPDRFSSGSQRDSKRPPTHRVAFGRTLKGSSFLTQTPTGTLCFLTLQ